MSHRVGALQFHSRLNLSFFPKEGLKKALDKMDGIDIADELLTVPKLRKLNS